MTLNTFWKLVEIQTKLASLFPFLLGTLYAIYYFDGFNTINTLIFFCSMLLFDMTTTAINNFMDYRKAKDEGYKGEVNIIGQAGIPEKTVIKLIWGMLATAAVLGIGLVVRTNLLLLFIGAACFFIGIFYTFGPVPISRMPLGEVISGLTMGFGIFFISVFVNVEEHVLMNLSFEGTHFNLSGDGASILTLFFVSLPTVFFIANIMLANNTCDLEYDIKNHRYTLPFYIGKKRSVQLFNLLVYLSYGVIIAAVILNLLHPVLLGILVTLIPVQKNLNAFNEKQIKEETFVVAIKNIIIFSGAEVILLTVSLFFR